jgi:ketosteroid isomerase-like protein
MDIAYVVGGNERSLLSIGVVLGGGEVDLKLRDHSPVSFEDAVANPATTTLSRGFLSAEPYIRFQVQPLMWLGLKLHLGYLFTLPGGWEEGGQEISGPSLNLTGPFVGISIAFGGIGTAEVGEMVVDVLEETLGETEFDEATCAAIKAFYEKRCGGELVQEETNAALVQDTLLAMSVGDLDTLEPLLAEDVSWVSPEGLLPWSGTWVGKDAFLAGLAAASKMEASLKIDRVLTSEDEVSVKWHLSPTEEGGKIAYGVTVCRIEEGKILSGRDYGN